MKRAILVVAIVAAIFVALDLFGLRYGYTEIEKVPGGYALVTGFAALGAVVLAWVLRGLRRRPDLYDDERSADRSPAGEPR